MKGYDLIFHEPQNAELLSQIQALNIFQEDIKSFIVAGHQSLRKHYYPFD